MAMKRSPMPGRRKPLRPGAPLARSGFKRREGQAPFPGRPIPPKKRKPLKQVSAKRRSERDERAAVVALVRARDRSCRGATLMPDRPCGGPLDVHERIQRSLWAAGYLDPDNCVLLCRAHHDACHDHPDQAHAVGLLRHSWERP